MKKRNIALFLALALVFGVAVGGTIAWLTDKTDEIVNTFTTGNVDIDLTETTGETYKMIPGIELEKDPTVTVKSGSEPCWVFVKVVETNSPATYLDYSIDEAWTALDGVDGVYYIQQDATTADVPYPVLTGNKVTVNDDITNTDMDAAEKNAPKLSFTAYAIQQEGFDNVADAWDAALANATEYAPTT